MNNNLIIETNNLTKTFYGKEVIKGCNMHVEKGSIYGFLGANGAGKTTVFKLLFFMSIYLQWKILKSILNIWVRKMGI